MNPALCRRDASASPRSFRPPPSARSWWLCPRRRSQDRPLSPRPTHTPARRHLHRARRHLSADHHGRGGGGRQWWGGCHPGPGQRRIPRRRHRHTRGDRQSSSDGRGRKPRRHGGEPRQFGHPGADRWQQPARRLCGRQRRPRRHARLIGRRRCRWRCVRSPTLRIVDRRGRRRRIGRKRAVSLDAGSHGHLHLCRPHRRNIDQRPARPERRRRLRRDRLQQRRRRRLRRRRWRRSGRRHRRHPVRCRQLERVVRLRRIRRPELDRLALRRSCPPTSTTRTTSQTAPS